LIIRRLFHNILTAMLFAMITDPFIFILHLLMMEKRKYITELCQTFGL